LFRLADRRFGAARGGTGTHRLPDGGRARQPNNEGEHGSISARNANFGYVEGRDLTIDYRFAEGDFERLPVMAAELVRGNPAVIVAAPTPAAVAAKNATSTIPIVMINGGDPEDLGLVQSLAHPGGNVTGISFGVGVETFGKGLELLKQACSDLPRVGILANAANPSHAGIIKRIEATARALNIEVVVVKVVGFHEFDKAFVTVREKGATGIIVIADVLFAIHGADLAQLAMKYRLPSMHGLKEDVEAGGLMSYGPDFNDHWRRAATFVDKLLHGKNPGDIPVEQPTKFDLVINLRTARALGLTIPLSLQAQADQIID